MLDIKGNILYDSIYMKYPEHHLSTARSAPTLLHEQSLLSHTVSDAQPVDLLLSGA